MKNKRKGFTIVELVIVIAVIAVLAAVMIPTFSAIVKRANISADTQTVRNMNIILVSESAASAPVHSSEVKTLLAVNGISDLSPQTRFYTFYWLENENTILLADEGDRPVYPAEYGELRYEDGNWHALDVSESIDFSDRGEKDEKRIFNVTVTQSGASVYIPFEIPATATESEKYEVGISIPEELQDGHYAIRKITAIMRDGDGEHKIVLRADEQFEKNVFEIEAVVPFEIPYVTGPVEIHLDIAEYCIATYRLATEGITFYNDSETRKMSFDKSYDYLVDCKSFCDSLLRPKGDYKIVSAKAVLNGVEKELYDPKGNNIVLNKSMLTEDFEIKLTVEKEDN